MTFEPALPVEVGQGKVREARQVLDVVYGLVGVDGKECPQKAERCDGQSVEFGFYPGSNRKSV